jgi:hypothetical protein
LQKNNTNDGRYRINSGISNIKDLGRIQEWKGMPNLTFWLGAFCNTINGTDGSIFPPFWSPKDKIYIYMTDICRYRIIPRIVSVILYEERNIFF